MSDEKLISTYKTRTRISFFPFPVSTQEREFCSFILVLGREQEFLSINLTLLDENKSQDFDLNVKILQEFLTMIFLLVSGLIFLKRLLIFLCKNIYFLFEMRMRINFCQSCVLRNQKLLFNVKRDSRQCLSRSHKMHLSL